jgi:hypothetical protein
MTVPLRCGAQVKFHNDLLHREKLRVAAEVTRLSRLVSQLADKLRNRTREAEALRAKVAVYEDDVQTAMNTAMVALSDQISRELRAQFERDFQVSSYTVEPCRRSTKWATGARFWGHLITWAVMYLCSQEKNAQLLKERDMLRDQCTALRSDHKSDGSQTHRQRGRPQSAQQLRGHSEVLSCRVPATQTKPNINALRYLPRQTI